MSESLERFNQYVEAVTNAQMRNLDVVEKTAESTGATADHLIAQIAAGELAKTPLKDLLELLPKSDPTP